MIRLFVYLFLLVSAFCLGGEAVWAASKRIALVVGNDNYSKLSESKQLKNAIKDARAIKVALEEVLNFKVIYGENLDRVSFEDKLDEFTSQIDNGDIAFFFYAGHGVSIGGGNYFLPSDIGLPASNHPNPEKRITRRSIFEQTVIDDMRDAGARVAIAVLDACRNNPLGGETGRSVGGTRGLSFREPADGTMSIYSAGTNQEALDRLPTESISDNSVFTRVFLQNIVLQGKNLSEIAEKTQEEVVALAKSVGREQRPAVYKNIIGEKIYLRGKPESDGKKKKETEVLLKIQKPKVIPEFELKFWDSVKDSTDPQIIGQYIKKYPTGVFVDLARAKVEKINVEKETRDEAEKRRKEELSDWGKVKNSELVKELEDFIAKYPTGPNVKVAKVRIETLRAIEQAQRSVEESLWDAAKESNDIEVLRSYLKRYANGRFSEKARLKIADLREIKQPKEVSIQEQAYWDAIKDEHSPTLLRKYMARYPNGAFLDIARDYLEIAEVKEQKIAEAKKREEETQVAVLEEENEEEVQELEPDICGSRTLSVLSGKQQAIKQIQLYYNDLNSGDSNCGVSRWHRPKSDLAERITKFSDALVGNIRIHRYRPSKGWLEARADTKVRAQGGRWERWRVKVTMVFVNGVWRISKIKAG